MKTLSVDLALVKKIGAKPALIYEYIRAKNFEDRGESKILYPEFMSIFGSDKTITRALRKLENESLIAVRKTNRGYYYKAIERR